MSVRTRNRFITFSILAGPFVFLLCLLLFWDAEPLPPIPPLPNPNGYEDLVKAGEMVTGDVGNFDSMSEVELRATAQRNSNAIELAREGLQQKCQVTLSYSPTSVDILVEHSAILVLAQAFAAEGRLAQMDKRTEDAIKSYLDLVRLGNASARGGVVIDQQIGMAIESIGDEQLQKLVDQLDAKSCHETALTLETLDSQTQTWDEVMQQERDWSRRAFSGMRYELVRLMERNSMQKLHQHIEQQFDARRSKTRQLIIKLATRAYELDKGHPPTNVAALVPDYLKAIPQDPLTGTNLVYLPR